VDLLLQHVAEAPAEHPDVVEVPHEDKRIHRRQVIGVVHQPHREEM
jgi:hypothetical protein